MTELRRVLFAAPRQVAIERGELPVPAVGELLVETQLSGISAGSELLAYRGELAPETLRDPTLPALSGTFSFPFTYGYAAVGKVIQAGGEGGDRWLGSRVMAMVPHASHFVCRPGELWPVPEEMASERAVFLPNAETAVSLVQDGQPVLGERVVVIGQGVVGLLVAGLLARSSMVQVVTIDRFAARRVASVEAGARLALDQNGADSLREAIGGDGADLVFELSGDPAALDLAIAACGPEGRIVVGSWYGERRAAVDLGTRFHRHRLRLISSQVSTIAPALRGRWSLARRLALAAEALDRLAPEKWIRHRFAVEEAAAAYALLDVNPGDCLQVVLRY